MLECATNITQPIIKHLSRPITTSEAFPKIIQLNDSSISETSWMKLTLILIIPLQQDNMPVPLLYDKEICQTEG